MKLNSKLLFYLIVGFAIVNILDIITAMYILPGEANPIYILARSTIMLWFVKTLFVFLVFYVYFKNQYPSRFWFFSFVYLIIMGIIMISFGVFSNVYGILNPTVVETAAQLSNAQKTNYYFNIVGFMFIIPYLITMLAFKIYDITEKNITYEVKK